MTETQMTVGGDVSLIETPLNGAKIEALRLARGIIVSRKECEPFLCNALTAVASCEPHLAHTCEELKKYIASVLPPKGVFSPTLEEWQWENGYPKGSRTVAQRKQDRLDWVDWMILCLEGWEPFAGGKQPVDGDQVVTVRLRDGTEFNRQSKFVRWFNWLGHGLSFGQSGAKRAAGHARDVIAWKVAK